MIRRLLWLSLVGVGIGLAGMTYLMARSLGPEPGANLVLMGMPCVAVPTLVASAAVIGLTRVGRDQLTRREWRAGRFAGWAAFVLSGLLATLA